MKRILTMLLMGAGALLCGQSGTTKSSPPAKKGAGEAKPTATLEDKVVVSKTEMGDFPTGGLLRLKNAVGTVTITGWDQPGFEMTTIKSTKTGVAPQGRDQANKLLENVRVATERKGDELTVSSQFPKHSKLARPFYGMTDFDLEYRIHVPKAARVDIDQVMGETNIQGATGDIHAIDGLGQINVLAPEGMYAIDARAKIGAVNSDFPGNERGLKWWVVRWPGEAFTATPSGSPQKMFLRTSYGDIVILKEH